MKPIITIFILIIGVLIALKCYTQRDNKFVFHVIDTSYQNNDDSFVEKHKILIKSNNSYFEVLNILNYSDDFYFVCSYLDRGNCNYFVFNNYGSAAGISKIYYIEPESKSIFESSSLFEYEIPLYNSFIKDSLVMTMISFKDSNCGIVTSKKLELLPKPEQNNKFTDLPKSYIIKQRFPYE